MLNYLTKATINREIQLALSEIWVTQHSTYKPEKNKTFHRYVGDAKLEGGTTTTITSAR